MFNSYLSGDHGSAFDGPLFKLSIFTTTKYNFSLKVLEISLLQSQFYKFL